MKNLAEFACKTFQRIEWPEKKVNKLNKSNEL